MTSIRYIAPARGGWSHPAGSFAQATRGYVQALDAAGCSVWLDSLCKEDSELYRTAQTQGPEVKAVERFAKPIAEPAVLICSAFATELPDLGALRRQLRYQAHILQTTFETTNPARSIVDAMKRWDAVFVPSTWNRDCLLDAGLEHVYAIPHVIPPEWHDLLTLPPPKSPAFTFGVVGTWEPRKASDLVVRAFAQAFNAHEAKLILKCGQIDWNPYATPQQCVAKYAGGHNVEIRDKILSRAELLKLYGEIDVLVSASHGEGFCLPVLEAKLAGRRVVCTDSGGPRDIVTQDDILVPGRTEVCAWSDMYGWPPGSMWHSHELEDLEIALLTARGRGAPKPFDASKFSAQVVGAPDLRRSGLICRKASSTAWKARLESMPIPGRKASSTAWKARPEHGARRERSPPWSQSQLDGLEGETATNTRGERK